MTNDICLKGSWPPGAYCGAKPQPMVPGNLRQRKFYKLLIRGNPQPTILHIPDNNDREMGDWGVGELVICKWTGELAQKQVVNFGIIGLLFFPVYGIN
jgi:hypothetical protein